MGWGRTAGEGEGKCAGQYVSESSLACNVFYLRFLVKYKHDAQEHLDLLNICES
jgi:hypothetical protein